MTESAVNIDRTIVCDLQTSQPFAFGKTTFATGCGAIRGMPDPREVVFGRLNSLRLELAKLEPEAGFHVEGKFASAVGIDKTTFSLIKAMERDLPFTAACRIKERWGISLDWLYYGEQPVAAQIMAKIGRGPVTEMRPKSSGRRKSA